MSKEKDFFEELEDNKKVKCVNCGREIKDLEKGCPYCDSKDYSYEKSIKENNSNTIASVLKVVGWIILVIGFILGFATGTDEYGSFVFTQVLTIWLIYGGLFLGIYAMGEVIQILHDIRAELRKKK